MLFWLLALAALIVIGLYIHHIFEGEWLPHDVMREWRLSRMSLGDLDQAWAAANNQSDITITLTTTPSRIALLHYTLKSLLDQTHPPARIILNIPEFSEREQIAYTIPPEITALSSVQINRCRDLGPGTKLIPTLSIVTPDTALLVLDDDRIYPNWLIERYSAAVNDFPDAALTMGGWVVPDTLEDTFTTILSSLFMRPPAPIRAPRLRRPREIDVMLVFSYLVRPSFFDVAAMEDLSAGPAELRFVDDVRTSALCNVPKMVIPAKSLSFVPWRQRRAFQSTRLGLVNRGSGTRHNTIAIQHFADRWRVGGKKAP